MYICYVDEAGDTGSVPSATSTVQPVVVLSALMLHQPSIRNLTYDFLNLKRKFFPRYCGRKHDLDDMRVEIKGSVLRKEIRESNKLRKHHFGFLDGVFQILVAYHARYTTHIWVKAIAQPLNGTAVYTTTVQGMCRHFQEFLVEKNDVGILVADFRSPGLNSDVSHSVFTQKLKATGDAFDRILEMPIFGHSDNHAGIQITDFLCSTLLFPIATQTYCLPIMPKSPHVHPNDARIKTRYAPKLRNLQYRYYRQGIWRGGISVDDKLQGWPSRLMVN